MKLSDRERKLLLLAFDPSASVGESANALRALFRDWLVKYPDGHTLVKDLEAGERPEEVSSRVVPRYGEVTLGFGKYKGEAIKEVPLDYLLWVLDNFEDLWPSTRKAIEKYLEGEK